MAVVVLVLAFLPVSYVMPPVPVTVGHALTGTVTAALGWVLLQFGYYYAGSVGRYAAAGFLGAVPPFVTFLNLGAIVLLVGVVVDVVLDR